MIFSFITKESNIRALMSADKLLRGKEKVS